MKARVLEGILIIAILISVGKAEDSDSERSEDPEISDPKDPEHFSRRRNTNNAKEDSDDLQTAEDTDFGKADTLSTSQKLNNSQSYAMEQTGSDSTSDTQTLSSLLTKYAFNNAKNIKVTEGRNYNPTLEDTAPSLKAEDTDKISNNTKNIVKQSSYGDNYKTKIDDASPEETLNGDAKQNGHENPFAQQSNSYPYNPNSSNLGSDLDDSVNMRSGYPYEDYTPYQVPSHNLAQASLSAGVNINNKLNHELNSYTFSYKPGFDANENIVSANAVAQSSTSLANAQNSAIINDDARSRVIWPHEYIFPHQTPGGETIIQCSRENELHYLWSSTLNCLVCICLNENGVLKPVCVSCSRCLAPSLPTQSSHTPDLLPPTPGPYVPLPIPDFPNPEPSIPTAQPIFNETTTNGNFEVTSPTPPPEATCNPLPTGQPFSNPLNPCLLCVCNQNMNMFGKSDVRIECRKNPDCVVPSDVTTILPPLPDVPFQATLPLCEKFPHHVVFPHPTDRCKECRCAQGMSAMNIPEQQISCVVIPECVSQIIDTPGMVVTPAPLIPIPRKTDPVPEPDIVPESGYQPVVIPTVTENPVEPMHWPRVSTTPLPITPIAVPIKGPLPGPPPHESCKPYPPNLPFQHPWDPCKICQCSEITVVGLINVEINCQTKPSCCTIEPQDVTKDAENQTPINMLYNGPSTFAPSSSTGYPGSLNAYIRPDFQNPVIQIPSSYQPGIAATLVDNLFANGYPQNQGHTEANPAASYYPHISGPFRSTNSHSNTVIDDSKSTTEAIANYNNSPSNSHTPSSSKNQAYAAANAVSQNTINYPGFNISEPQQTTQAIATVDNIKPIGELSSLLATQKPTSTYSQYYPDVTQNYAKLQYNHYPENSQHNFMTEGLGNPAETYDLYNPNSIYSRNIYATEKPQYNAFNGISENHAYLSANGQSQNTLTNPTRNQGYGSNTELTQDTLSNVGYYVPGSYPSSKALNKANSVAQAPAVAIGENDYSSSLNFRRPTISGLSSGYTFGIKKHLNPEISIFPGKINGLLDGFMGSSLKYNGKYDTDQGDVKSLLKSQNIYYPLSSRYSQDLGTKNMYSSLYPKLFNYNMNPFHQFGHFGVAHPGVKIKNRSGADNPDSLETSK